MGASETTLAPARPAESGRIHPLATALSLVARLMARAQVCWVGVEPALTPRVYYGNHSSHLDAVVI